MNKLKRHELIKEMIQNTIIRTQEEIKERLMENGINVTQATLSRDLRELGLTKIHDDEGTRYILAGESDTSDIITVLADYVLSVSRASFVLVFHTQLGEADVLANLVDKLKASSILGTVAGADTLLAICKDEAAAKEIENQLAKVI